MNKKRKISFLILSLILGGISGFVYYKIKGCESGCMIWSSPYLSSAVGALLGFLIIDLILDQLTKKNES
ncbi:MAG TPA: hypothetical protein DIU39_05375 [Flavobacteriales bacterium]|nr:hypothetical protein [Flavobacteriales bacterium]|tara:strand:+ start:3008 stop:3214 length:207 start_codon:yes stop_codon:yes gene_type:complete